MQKGFKIFLEMRRPRFQRKSGSRFRETVAGAVGRFPRFVQIMKVNIQRFHLELNLRTPRKDEMHKAAGRGGGRKAHRKKGQKAFFFFEIHPLRFHLQHRVPMNPA